jgi:hypothetical protein
VLLCERRLGDGFVGRAATLYGWGIAVSYGVLTVLAPSSGFVLTRRALVTALGMVGALVLLAAWRNARGDRRTDPVTALACEHGTSAGTLRLARAGALLVRLVKTIGAPILTLGLVAWLAALGEAAP